MAVIPSIMIVSLFVKHTPTLVFLVYMFFLSSLSRREYRREFLLREECNASSYQRKVGQTILCTNISSALGVYHL